MKQKIRVTREEIVKKVGAIAYGPFILTLPDFIELEGEVVEECDCKDKPESVCSSCLTKSIDHMEKHSETYPLNKQKPQKIEPVWGSVSDVKVVVDFQTGKMKPLNIEASILKLYEAFNNLQGI